MIIVSQDRKQIVNHDNVTRIFIENLENVKIKSTSVNVL